MADFAACQITNSPQRFDLLCIPFRYLFSLRSKMVYLSFARISSSLGISAFHLSTDLVVSPFLASALSSVATTESTARRRRRCRRFWNLDSRHGVFHSRPLLNGFVNLNAPNMAAELVGGKGELLAIAGRCRRSRLGNFND